MDRRFLHLYTCQRGQLAAPEQLVESEGVVLAASVPMDETVAVLESWWAELEHDILENEVEFDAVGCTLRTGVRTPRAVLKGLYATFLEAMQPLVADLAAGPESAAKMTPVCTFWHGEYHDLKTLLLPRSLVHTGSSGEPFLHRRPAMRGEIDLGPNPGAFETWFGPSEEWH